MCIERCVTCKESKHASGILWECLPVPAFGNARAAGLEVATVGLNPAWSEFVTKDNEPRPPESRLAMLCDYKTSDRARLSDDQVKAASIRGDDYFRNAPHRFFTALDDLMQAMNPSWSYRAGTAAHLDIVACATKPFWSDLRPEARGDFMRNCRPHFLRGLETISEESWLLFNGSGSFDALAGPGVRTTDHAEASIPDYGSLRVWWGRCNVGSRRLRYFGWNCFLQYSKANEALGILRGWRQLPSSLR